MKRIYEVISNGYLLNVGWSDEIKIEVKIGDTIYAEDEDTSHSVCLSGIYNNFYGDGGRWIDLSDVGNFVHFIQIGAHPSSSYYIKDCLEVGILRDITISINRSNKLNELGI